MAQQTELQVYALPGGLHSFIAKTEAEVAEGPYRIAAAHVHVAGGAITYVHQAGGEHAHAHVPGATKAIVTAG